MSFYTGISFLDKMIKKIFFTYIKNPLIVLIFLIHFLFISSISFINPLFNSPLTEYTYLFFFGLIFIFINSIFLTLIIQTSYSAFKDSKTKINLRKIPGNFLLLLISSAFYFIIFQIANIAGMISSAYLSEYAFYISTLVFIMGLFLILLLSFQNFYYTLEKSSIIKSIKKSIKMSVKNYPKILLVFIIFFFLEYLNSLIQLKIMSELISYMFLYPLLFLILTQIFNKHKNV